MEAKNLLLIGVDITSLARSAKKAGYRVYSVDYYGDQDLRLVSDEFFSMIEQTEGSSCGRLNVDFYEAFLLRGAKKISDKVRVDGILLSTGLDDSPNALSELSKIAPILGNSPELIQKVRDKERFFHQLNRLKVPFPETAVVHGFSETLTASKDIGYPLLVKPIESFGGSHIRKAENSEELRRIFKRVSRFGQEAVIQKYVPGIAASVSVVSSRNKAATLTVNEQLIGSSLRGQAKPFAYCGNIVPLSLSEDVLSRCREAAEKIVAHFELVGSNGVDFVISRDHVPLVVEVNPRFQGTLECVENVLGINVVKAHVDACTNDVLPKIPNVIKFCTRLILFALHRSVVPDLGRYPETRDIPLPGVIIEKGEPVCSIITEGKSRDSSFKKARNVAERILSSLKPIR